MALGTFSLGLGFFAAGLVLALTVALWMILARRWPRAAWAVPAVGLLLVVGCFAPAPREDTVYALAGHSTGSAWLEVRAGTQASVLVTGGTGSVERLPNGSFLVLDCPAGCDFAGGTRSDDPARSLGLDEGATLFDSVHGELRLEHTPTLCQRLPVVVALSFSATCASCSARVYEAAAADGRLQGDSSAPC